MLIFLEGIILKAQVMEVDGSDDFPFSSGWIFRLYAVHLHGC